MSTLLNEIEKLIAEQAEKLAAEREKDAYARGQRDALDEIRDVINDRIDDRLGLNVHISDVGNSETVPDEEDATYTLAPYLRRAVEFVTTNPGTSCAPVEKALGSSNGVYRAAEMGLIEKRGSQFFPLSNG